MTRYNKFNVDDYNYTHNRPDRVEKRRHSGTKPGAFWSADSEKYNDDQKKGRFSFDTIHGLKLKQVEYKVPPMDVRKARREEFDGVYSADKRMIKPGARALFLKHLAENHRDELKEKLGFSDKEIDTMVEKGYAPLGYNVHHKLAIHGGGKNEFSNFILAPVFPHDQWHKDVMDPQLLGLAPGESRKILIPYTDAMIFDPKEYGVVRNNQPIKPNYRSVVEPNVYSQNYLPEHVADLRQKKGLDVVPKAAVVEKSSVVAVAAGLRCRARG